MSFEVHVTCHRHDGIKAQAAVKAFPNLKDLHFSAIDGDPQLGKKAFCYFTTHSNNYITAYHQMKMCVAALQHAEVPVLREKIEMIMYDTKTGVGV